MSIIILGLLLYRMIPAECHFWEFVGRSSLQSNWKLSTADIQHQFIVNHSKSLNKPYRDKHDKVTNTINIYQHGSASNGVILMGHNMGHREEDVSIVGEQGSCGSFALRRYRWNSWPKAPKSVPFVTICVVATEVWFTKALPSFSCFMFLLYLEYCGVVPQNVYIFDSCWPTLLFIANVQLDHWNIQKPRYEPATSCEWFHIVAWFTSKWLQISISTKCCKHSKQVAHVACGRGWKTWVAVQLLWGDCIAVHCCCRKNPQCSNSFHSASESDWPQANGRPVTFQVLFLSSTSTGESWEWDSH